MKNFQKFLMATILISLMAINEIRAADDKTKNISLDGLNVRFDYGGVFFNSHYSEKLSDNVQWRGGDGNDSSFVSASLEYLWEFNWFLLGIYTGIGYNNPQGVIGENANLINGVLYRGMGSILYGVGLSLGIRDRLWQITGRIGARFNSPEPVTLHESLSKGNASSSGSSPSTPVKIGDEFKSIQILNGYGLYFEIGFGVILTKDFSVGAYLGYNIFSTPNNAVNKLKDLIKANNWIESDKIVSDVINPIIKGIGFSEIGLNFTIRF